MEGETREKFPVYHRTFNYHLDDSRFVRVSEALRGVAWDIGNSRYLFPGANTEVRIKDDEYFGGLDIAVMTFLETPEKQVLDVLKNLGAVLTLSREPKKIV
jgi:hypothetical protein